MQSETNLILVGVVAIVAAALVGMMILGAVLVAKRETRPAGLWILGGLLALAVILPLAWLLVGYGAADTTYTTDAWGRQVQVQRAAPPTAPIVTFMAIAVALALVAGEIALLIYPRTRTAGLALLGVGVVAASIVMVRDVERQAPQPIAEFKSADGADPQFTLGDTLDAAAERTTLPAEPAAPANGAAPTPPDAPPAPKAPEPTDPQPATTVADGAAAEASPPTTETASIDAAQPSTSSTYAYGVTLTVGGKESLPDWAKHRDGIGPDGSPYSVSRFAGDGVVGDGLSGDGTYFVVVRSGPYRTLHDCQQAMRRDVPQAIREYGSRLNDGRGRWPVRALPDALQDQLVGARYLETGDFSVGEMMTLYTRLDFTPANVAAINSWQADLLARNRTLFAGVLGGLIVALVGIVYAYFRIDTATLGYYTWRLRIAAGVLLAVVVVAGIISGALFFDEEWRLGGIMF